MPVPLIYQPVDIKPLSGPMDTRSSPDSVPPGAWRMRQNVAVFDQGKACRRPGWSRYRYDRAIYNNEDLHDQLLSLAPAGAARQPITFLYAAVGTTGVRKLLAGTQNRLYALDEGKGNWTIIADIYGGDAGNGLRRRWQAAQVNNALVFTNNYDPPLVYIFDQGTFGPENQSVAEIPSLATIGLTKAGTVASWKGTIFLGDVEEDGERVEHRVVWSRFELPMEWLPGPIGSNGTAGFADLSYGGKILAMKALGDVLLIYTTKSIWQVEYVGGDQVFAFTERYAEPDNGSGCLAYRRTLINTGQQHLYLGFDGVYSYNLFSPQPDRLEWIHRATSELFRTIDETACEFHVAHFYPATKEMWISWVELGQTLPRRTLVLNTQYETDDFVDHGFAAFANHTPDDRGSILDFLISRGLCTPAEIAAHPDLVPVGIKQGEYCDDASAVTNPGALPDRNTPIWTNQSLNVGGRLVEDYTKATPDANSLCAILGNLTFEDLCAECAKAGFLVMADAEDWTLKEFHPLSGVYSREATKTFAACGTWEKVGYDEILRTAAADFGYPREDKNMRAIEVEYSLAYEAVQALPSVLEVRVGISAQAVDSNNIAPGKCAIVWHNLQPKNLECLSDRSGGEHLTAGTRPTRTLNWAFLYTGRFFYLELKIAGMHGAVCISRVTAEVRQVPRSANS